jgi:hypothetical protein
MRLLTTIFLLTIIYSCKNTKQHDRQIDFDNNLLIGEWRLDSSSNRFFSYDRLIILEDSSFYLFSGSDGGSLITKGQRFGKDSITTEYYGSLKINLIDSNHLHLGGGWTNNENFYKRAKQGDFHDNLKEYLQQDSLRHNVIGWWKLVSCKMPVKLINYSGYYNNFTLNIRDDGNAIFYLENKLDSTVDYSYKVNPDGIDFNRGCIVGSDCKTSFDSKGRMKLVLDHRMGDTLLLERLTDVK